MPWLYQNVLRSLDKHAYIGLFLNGEEMYFLVYQDNFLLVHKSFLYQNMPVSKHFEQKFD